MKEAGFEIQSTCHIDYHQSDILQISFTPKNEEKEYNFPLNIRYIGGIHQFYIKGCGVNPELVVYNKYREELPHTDIELGAIPIYSTKTFDIIIKNVSSIATSFNITKILDNVMEISPREGYLPPKTEMAITVLIFILLLLYE